MVDSRTIAEYINASLAHQEDTREGPVVRGKSRALAELRRALTTMARSPLPVIVEGGRVTIGYGGT